MQGKGMRIFLLRVAAVLCAALSCFSAVMTGTYAWESKQAVTNDLSGSADVLMSVVLEKLEKDTNAPIAGAVFYLYREDGTQIGGRYETNEFGMICVQLGLGEYYFEEERPPLGYTYDTDTEGNPIKRYPFTVVAQDMPISITAYNIQLTGSLIISKTVQNSDGTALSEEQKGTEFSFTVSFSDGGTYDYTIGSETMSLASGDTLQLSHGENAVFENMPFGLLYDVTEESAPGYTVSSTGHRGNITETTAVAEFVNTWQGGGTGTLVITKEVCGEGADFEREFSFTATIGGVQESFVLKHGQSKTFSNIALGTDYQISEQPCDGYTASVEEYSGVVNAAETVMLPFVNTYHADPPVGTGSLTITKTVTGITEVCTDSFYFHVQFSGEDAPEDATVILNGLNSYTDTIIDIPAGVRYVVTEVLAQGYLPIWTQVSGTVNGDETAGFINRAQQDPVLPDGGPVDITVTKILSGEIISSDAEREFRMTMLLGGEATSFTLKGGESRVFEDVPYGAVYELREDDYIAEGFAQSVVNGSGVATETDIVVTNTYVGVPKVEIRGEKTWDKNGVESLELPESITVKLMDGEKAVDEQTVILNSEGKWLYSFTADKYRADGTEIIYTVSEVPVDGFSVTYDGYNIQNAYVIPVWDDPPVITKVVTGENAPQTEFTFVFERVTTDAPMPEDSTGSKKEVTLIGGGAIEIGEIYFERAGTYVYRIYEQYGGVKGWKYDTAQYTVTYVVTENAQHQLESVRTMVKNDVPAAEVVFTNTYSEIRPEMVTISGEKIWVHRNNPVAKRPASIVIEVYGDGVRVYQQQVTAENGWRYSAELPKFDDDGHLINYTVDEQPVTGYSKTINGYNITNTYRGTVPDGPSIPEAPDIPDDPVDSSDTGDDSRIPFWTMMTLGSMLGTVIAIYVLRANAYAGKRVYFGKRLKR